jgi:hypothetical protein
VPIGIAIAKRARENRLVQEIAVAESGTEYERCKVAGAILERVAKRARRAERRAAGLRSKAQKTPNLVV